MNKDKIEILCNYLNNNTAQRYPIANGELAGSTDYIKNGYLKMLAVVLQQAGTITDAQLNVFKRIVAGADVDNSAEDYLRMALDIEISDFVDYSNECKELAIKYRWVLDALIITCVTKQCDEQIRLVAQFAESFEVTKSELEYIATMGKAIISMDDSAYVSAYEIKVDSIPDAIFSEYMFLISSKCVCSNDNMTIFHQTSKQEITIQILEKIKEINTPCVKIIGAHIKVDDCKIIFENKEKVILEDCTFVGGEKNPVCFTACEEVILSNCRFENFKTRTIVFNEINRTKLVGCIFKNCKLFYSSGSDDWKVFGGVLYSDRPKSIGRCDLIDDTFEDCGGVNSKNYYRSAFISNILSFVDQCRFINCWHMNEDNNVDPDDERRTMFTSQSSSTNCFYENSAKFN